MAQDVLNRKEAEPIDLQILKQCFDAIWPQECLSDFFQYGVQDHSINILYDGTLNTQLAIRTPFGITERKKWKNSDARKCLGTFLVCNKNIINCKKASGRK